MTPTTIGFTAAQTHAIQHISHQENIVILTTVFTVAIIITLALRIRQGLINRGRWH